jgi:uracil-DNA glycosylase
MPQVNAANHQEQTAADFLPSQRTLANLRQAARECRGCDLYRNATQTVFGAGPENPSLVFVGEQPGDQEDRQGTPFVGPAGRLLDGALEEARIERGQVYVTNAVKHFKWIWRGKRRLHQKPSIRQVNACKPWLETEIELLEPKIIVCMGSTAAHSVLGRPVAILKERGKFVPNDFDATPLTFITIHPSAIYRQRERSDQELEFRRFAEEIKLVGDKLRVLTASGGDVTSVDNP